jgi:hypothetical protein
MKFTHVLKFNSVPEWRESYINYPLLKKLVLAASTAEAYEAYEGHPPGVTCFSIARSTHQVLTIMQQGFVVCQACKLPGIDAGSRPTGQGVTCSLDFSSCLFSCTACTP